MPALTMDLLEVLKEADFLDGFPEPAVSSPWSSWLGHVCRAGWNRNDHQCSS